MITISKKEFESMYNSMTLQDLSDKLGVSKVTINSYLKKLNIKGKGKGGWKRKLIIK